MINNKKDVKLYNVLFPIWFLLLFPGMWLIVLPGNFIIDSLVLIIGILVLKVADKWQFYKRHILKIFIFGLLSDLVGSAFMLLMLVLEISQTGDEHYLTLPAIILSSALIFIFNYFVTFRKNDGSLRLKLSLTFALITAPYTFLIPTSWLYF